VGSGARLAAGALPGLLTAAVLAALLAAAPSAAVRGVREGGAVEWAQVALALVALGFIAAAPRRSPLDALLATLLAVLVASEIDLDRRLLGLAVVDWDFFLSGAVPLGARVVAGAGLSGTALALGADAAVHRRALLEEALAARRRAWGPLLLAGILLFGAPQICERCMTRLLPPPRYFLEESLELAGAVYVAARAGRRRGRASIPPVRRP
jgi:hypothetical protein